MVRLFIFVLSLVAFGCATAPANSPAPAPDTSPTAPGVAPGIYRVAATLEPISFEVLIEELSTARFVLVAESHGREHDHRVQQEIFEALIEEVDDIALGMEMFQRPFQESLDAYVMGDIDESTMLMQTEWAQRWGFTPELYAPLWRRAAEQERPVLALNARRELTRRVASVGVDGLSAAEKNELPEIAREPEEHRQWLVQVFAAHGMTEDDERFENFYTAQLIWDETMAQVAFDFAMESGVSLVYIVSGRGHIERGWGIPSRLERRLMATAQSDQVLTVIPMDAADVDPEKVVRTRLGDFIVAW